MLKEVRRLINPPYSSNDLITLFLVLFLLLAIPMTVLGLQNRQSLGLLASSNPCSEDSSDTVKPSVYFSDPKDGSHVVGNDFLIKLEAEDNQCVKTVKLEIDGREAKTFKTTPYIFNWDMRRVAVGNHTLSATATDNSGNVSISSISIIRGIRSVTNP
jgi:hypothetical protein